MILQVNEAYCRQFCHMISYTPSVKFKAVMQLDETGNIIAATGYDHWTPNSVSMHVWIPDPKRMVPKFVKESFRYPFEIGNRGLVIGVTPGDNTRALEFNKKIGFRETHRVKDGWALGTDMVIQEMRRDECRWISRRS